MVNANRRQLPKMFVWLLLLLCSVQHSSALIVPQELPSILSLVYSNIPPVKKGTDSRLGFGFRLGEHADFQVIVELGPQKETRPLGDQEPDNSFSKRQINKAQQIAMLHQQLRQQQREQQQQQQQTRGTTTERTAATWLESWSKDMTASKKTKINASVNKSQMSAKKQREKSPAPALMPTAPVMKEHALKQLQMLYQMATTTTITTTAPPTPIKSDSLNLAYAQSAVQPSQQLTNLPGRKTPSEITAELMDVSLEDGT